MACLCVCYIHIYTYTLITFVICYKWPVCGFVIYTYVRIHYLLMLYVIGYMWHVCVFVIYTYICIHYIHMLYVYRMDARRLICALEGSAFLGKTAHCAAMWTASYCKTFILNYSATHHFENVRELAYSS